MAVQKPKLSSLSKDFFSIRHSTQHVLFLLIGETFASSEDAPLLVNTKNRTSGRGQFSEHAQSNRFAFLANQICGFVRINPEHAQSDGKSVNRGFLVLDFPRDRDSWCWPKGARPLGASGDENVGKGEIWAVSFTSGTLTSGIFSPGML